MNTKGLFDDVEEEKPSKPKPKKREKKSEEVRIPEGEVERELHFPLNTQTKIIRIVNNALGRGTLPHALLLTSEVALGKWEFAFELAKTVLCERNRLIPSCDLCTSCKKVISGNHPDIMTISHDERYITIDEVREVRKQVKFTPFESERRFLLIKNAERMRHEPQNALLKTLEEPPPSLIIILTTSQPHLLLDTILSRVMSLQLSPPGVEETSQHLVEKYDVSEETAGELYKFFMGNLPKIEDYLGGDIDEKGVGEYLSGGLDEALGDLVGIVDERKRVERTAVLEMLDGLFLRLRGVRERLGFERFEEMAMEVLRAKERIGANVSIQGTLTYLVEALRGGSGD